MRRPTGTGRNKSEISHNSSTSKLGKERFSKPPTSNTRISQSHADEGNKYVAILKKITQDSGRQYSCSNTINSNHSKQKAKDEKDYEVIDSSGGTQDNIIESSITRKSNHKMYGTEKIDMKKYNNLMSQSAIMVEGDKEDEASSEHFSEPKVEYPLQPGKALKLFMNKLPDYEKSEILDYKSIYFLGLSSKKIEGNPLKDFNYGYDDDRGDYNVVIGDHIAYRFEVIDLLGKGSFGQALK